MATGMTDDAVAPRPGDLSVCLNCGHLMQYDDAMMMAPLDPDALSMLAPEVRHEVQRAVALIKQRGLLHPRIAKQ